MSDLFVKYLLRHISTVSVILLMLGYYLYGQGEYLHHLLPINGKPLALFTLTSVITLFELQLWHSRETNKKLEAVIRQIKVSALTHSVNDMYERYNANPASFFKNEYAIMELNTLKDVREELSVNSYTQGRIEYLLGKI